MSHTKLARSIRQLASQAPNEMDRKHAETTFFDLLGRLDHGSVRAASCDTSGNWTAHTWVKQGLLLGFRLGLLTDRSEGVFRFFDKHTFPLRTLSLEDGVRLVPGGSAIRAGTYVAPGVICMPPMYINTGAYVDRDTMIDSHALVGSCAQIGKRVHLSAAAQIGGVLEPASALPVIVEDDAFIGGGCGLYEGIIVRSGAVLAPGVILTRATRLFDLVHEQTIEAKEVPPNAVVVPGARAVASDFGRAHGLSLYSPVIVKYRDAKTDAATALENALR